MRRSCEVGCFCFKGFFRNSQGVCVPLDECERNPIVFGGHESHRDHQQSSGEEFASNSVEEMHTSIQDDNQRDSRHECPVDEVYSDCGSRCTESCDNSVNPGVCPPNICDIGCFCKFGLYRDHEGIQIDK